MPYSLAEAILEPISRGAGEVLRRVDSLIAKSTALRGKTSPGRRQLRDLINLPGFVEQIAVHCEAAALEREIRVDVDIAPDALIFGTFCALHGAMEQLVQGALDNTPPGGCLAIAGGIRDGVVTLTFSSCCSEGKRGNGGSCSGDCPAADWACSAQVERALKVHGGRVQVSRRAGNETQCVIQLPFKSEQKDRSECHLI